MRRLFATILIVILTAPCMGQGGFKAFISSVDSMNRHHAREKIFIHYDRPHYNLGDTLWARGYIAVAWNHSLNDSSRLVYLEIIDPKGKIVHRSSASCLLGQFDASISLKEDMYTEGTYLLRAYTRWMLNFGDSLFYQSYFKILDFKSPKWQTTIKKLSITDTHLQLQAQLKQLHSSLQPIQPVEAIIRSKRKKIATLSGFSDIEGNFAIDTLFPKILNKKELSLELLKEGRSLITIPLTMTSLQPADLQFLPEGGSFIAGCRQRLGFKATDPYGKGMDVKGLIKNSKGATVTGFTSVYKGMGSVIFTPQTGEQYTAVLENGLQFELPQAGTAGLCLSVTEHTDSLLVQVRSTVAYGDPTLYLAAATRGVAYVRGKIELKKGLYRLMLAKSNFPSGVVRFTIYDPQMRPLNERAAFIWHSDDLKLDMVSDKPEYITRDSVGLSIRIKGYDPADSIAFFSLAVIDSSQVPYNVYRENIVSYMLLSSDLKGEVEDPYYYFKDPVPGAMEALMLTQGWVQYRWQPSSFKFSPEKEVSVSGRVINLGDKGLTGINLLLKGKSGVAGADFVKYATTDQEGRFVFNNFPPLKDSAGFAIKAFERKANTFMKSIGAIKIDELPGYEQMEDRRYVKENLALDTAVKTYIQKQVQLKRGKEYLEEVVVKAKGKIPGSHLLRPADYVFTGFEDDETFSEFFFGKVFPGLRDKNPSGNGLMVAFFADGVFAGFDWCRFNDPAYDLHYSASKNSFLFFYSMKNDIKAVEALTDRKSVMVYQNKYDWHELVVPGATKDWVNLPNFNKMKYYVVEVTTYTGKGPGMYRSNPYKGGEEYYFPLIPVIAKEFYQPRYSVPLKEDELPQLPATVYWKNYLMPDNKGILKAGFYTSDSDKNYLVVVQGMNANGKLAFLQQVLPVKKQ
ncbi:hypothetical protein [Niabella aurantiaca]|uniref:hypothetical protein n=1 Tax=Niabella aurantiaca TaxID=379900 RepID=UPI00037D18A2|nr:hypothetical protein [Niabella aurantiaca]